jgi:hypothetical protein
MNIWIYISGNLAADSMMLLYHHLAEVFPQFKYKLISDDFLPTLSAIEKKGITIIDPFDTGQLFLKGDFLLLGVMTPGNKERSLILQAKSRKSTAIAFLNDLGGGARKFFENGQMILPDYIAVADLITYQNLLKAGVPTPLLLKAGSIFLDSINAKSTDKKKKGIRSIGYLSVPNNDDAAVWLQELGYSEMDIAHDLASLKKVGNKYTLTIRKHPKESGSTKYESLSSKNIYIEDHSESTIEDFVLRHSVLVSSYSTGLLVAAKLGKPVISYQPNSTNPVRAELYSLLRIPVLTDKTTLECLINESSTAVPTIDNALFNSGNVLHYISSFLQPMLTNTL